MPLLLVSEEFSSSCRGAFTIISKFSKTNLEFFWFWLHKHTSINEKYIINEVYEQKKKQN